LIFVSCLFMSISIHLRLAQVLLVISSCAQKNINYQHEWCGVLLPKMCCFTRQLITCKGEQYWCQQIRINSCRVTFFFSSIQKNIYCNFVSYVVGRCDVSSSFVSATSICLSICFYLGMWIMHQDLGSTHYMDILLS